MFEPATLDYADGHGDDNCSEDGDDGDDAKYYNRDDDADRFQVLKRRRPTVPPSLQKYGFPWNKDPA